MRSVPGSDVSVMFPRGSCRLRTEICALVAEEDDGRGREGEPEPDQLGVLRSTAASTFDDGLRMTPIVPCLLPPASSPPFLSMTGPNAAPRTRALVACERFAKCV